MRGMDEMIVMMVVMAVLGMPVISLVMAIVAYRRATSGRREDADQINTELSSLRRTTDRLGKRLVDLEARVQALAAGAPAAAAAPSVPVSAAPLPEQPAPAAVKPESPRPAPSVPAAMPGGVPPTMAAQTPRPPSRAVDVPTPAGTSQPPRPAPAPVAPPPAAPAPHPTGAAPPTVGATGAPVRPMPPMPPSWGAATPPSKPPSAAPERQEGWERRLGINLPVWIGAIALMLSGVFLVKFSVEHGMLGPLARVTLATILGIALLGAGEWLRTRSAMTGQGASAAGVAVLYAAFLAGTSLYHLIAPLAGFGLMALVTLAAVALSLRQGIIVAVLGLVGGFFTPYWIGVVSASPARLFAYLLLLQAGLIVVTRKRQWNGLAALTLVMGLGAALHRASAGAVAADAPWIGAFLLVSAASFVFAARSWKPAEAGAEGRGVLPISAYLGYGALLGAFLTLGVLAARTRFGLLEWAFLGILAIASLILGRLDAEYGRMPWISFVVVVILQAGWIMNGTPSQRPDVWLVAAGTGLVFGLGAWLAHHGSSAPASWATLSASGGLTAFGLAWWVDKIHGTVVPHWGLISLALALLYLIPAGLTAAPERRRLAGEATLAAFCVAVTAFISFAVPLELEAHWLSVAWAMEAAALAWLLHRLRVDILAYLGMLVSAGVIVRLLLNPEVLHYPLGPMPVFNWILYGYGIPAAAFALAALWYQRAGWKATASAYTWGASALLFALLTLEVRHAFHPAGLVGTFPKIVEWATYSNLWIAAGLLAIAAYLKWRQTVVGLAGLTFLALAACKIALFDCLVANPLWTPDSVGSLPVLNWLVYVYALPAAGFALAAWALARCAWPAARTAAAVASGALAMVFLALEVRQGFHTAGLPGAGPSLVEWGTYTLVYLAAGLLLLLAYARWDRELLKHAGMAFLLVAIIKAFLVELLGANPLWNHLAVGTAPLANWLVYVYALPALALLAVKPLLSQGRGRNEEFIKTAQVAALVLAAAFLSLEVRQAFHPGFLDTGGFSLVEVATYGHVWLLMGAGLILGWVRWHNEPAMWGGRILYALALIKLLVFDAGLCNPLLWHQDVGGWPVINGLLYVYGLPILLLALMARLPAGEDWRSLTGPVSLYGGLALGLLLLTLEVRQYFHPHFLDRAPLEEMENYAYSAAWILFSLLLLMIGILKRGRGPRVASLVVILLAIIKVFVYDLRHLEDLYRIGSFLALGVSLMLIAYLFQRYVFAEVRRE